MRQTENLKCRGRGENILSNGINQKDEASTSSTKDYGGKKSFAVTRDPIPDNSSRQVKWLIDKAKWESSKLIHEMSGPNKENWIKILSNPEAYDVVFSILSRKDIRDGSTAAPLYLDLLTAAALQSMQTYMCEGSLSNDKVEDMIEEGRGGRQWYHCIEVADNLLVTVSVLLKFSPHAQLNSSLTMLIEALKSRLDKLCPEEPPLACAKMETDDYDEGEEESSDKEEETKELISYTFMEPWVRGCGEPVKRSCVHKSRTLRSLFDWIHETQKSARRTEKLKKEVAAQKEAEEKSTKRNSWENAKGGIEFLNDPRHDSDFLTVKVVPTASEILANKPLMLPQNLVQQSFAKIRSSEEDDVEDMEEIFSAALAAKPVATKFQYRSWHHYLNTHFLLLREDCLAGLRRSIKNFRDRVVALSNSPNDSKVQQKLPNRPSLIKKAAEQAMHAGDEERYNMYLDVDVISVDSVSRQGLGFEVIFTIPGGKKVNWRRSSRFMNGALLCLSSDGSFDEETIVFATVLKSVVPSDSPRWTPSVTIGLDQSSYSRFNATYKYTMIESPVFFEAYRPVLVKLQKLAHMNCSFSDILIGKTKTVGYPAYVVNALTSKVATRAETIQGWKLLFERNKNTEFKIWNPLGNERFPSLPSLDEAQRKAIELALTKKLTLIQGPPGCGKTYVGVIITRILLANRKMRAERPILFVCQTNHALDQILEHVYEHEKSIIRIGSRSESLTMQSLTLQAAASKLADRTLRTGEEFRARDELKLQAATLRANIAQQGSISREQSRDFDVKATFLDINLARLWNLLKTINQEKYVELIFDSSPSLPELFTVLRKAIEKRLKTDKCSLPVWMESFDDWMSLPVERRLLQVTAYSPRRSTLKQAVNHWVDSSNVSAYLKSMVPSILDDSESVSNQKNDNSGDALPFEDDDDEYQSKRARFGVDDFDYDLLSEDGYDTSHGYKLFPNMLNDENLACQVVYNNDVDIYSVVRELPDHLRGLSKISATHDPLKMQRKDRILLMEFWVNLLYNDSLSKSDSAISKYQRALAIESQYFARVDAAVMKNAAVIGMTTNGAAKYSETLSQLGCEVLIVEEAAEVLEAPILAALTQSTEHAILIGDHQQLRPQVNEYNLAQRNKLEISLFERLINAGLPHVTLRTQRRMHPEVSSLITPFIYNKLNDDPSVLTRPPVRGIKQRVFFFQHSYLEDSHSNSLEAADAGGKSNLFEAKMIISTAQHLLHNGYTHDQIVIITMYKSQVRIIKNEAAALASVHGLYNERVTSIRVTTTDNYQGEESDIVFLSLVRSNKEKKSGFVKIPNRVCVALSRARCGLYVFGNLDMIRSTSPLWDKVCCFVDTRQQLGSSLELRCENHPDDTPTQVFCVEDFRHSPNGGCMRRCNGLFSSCKHPCPLLCHSISHESIICPNVCEKPRAINCVHLCHKPCGVDCGPCEAKVLRVRSQCGHSLSIRCADDVEEVDCTAPCPITQLCGHPCREKCSHNHSPTYKCRDPCQRTRMTCLHPCRKICFETCGPCLEDVSQKLPCGHIVSIPCNVDLTTYQCTEPCSMNLDCGHKCPNKCHEKCVVVCEEMVKKPVSQCKRPIPHEIRVLCSEVVPSTPCTARCSDKLPCGHFCKNNCEDCLVGTESQPPKHRACTFKCNKKLLCNHFCGERHSCGSECPPCERDCEIRCSHRKCDLTCGAPCRPCVSKCDLSCPHVSCFRRCDDFHSIIPTTMNTSVCTVIEQQSFPFCNNRCKKKLQCGHNCLGFCGERCPSLCNVCKPIEIENLLRRKPNKGEFRSLRFVTLACNHNFEVEAIGRSIGQQLTTNSSYLKCPEKKCSLPLQGVFRFDHFYKQSVKQLRKSLLKQRSNFWMEEYEADLNNQLSNAVIDQLQAKLSSAKNPLYSEERPIIKMFLGKALFKSDRLREADEMLSSAFNSLSDNPSKALVANLRGLICKKDPKTAKNALSFFETAISLDSTKEEYVVNLVETKQSLDKLLLARRAAIQRNEEVQKAKEGAATLKRHAESLEMEGRKKASTGQLVQGNNEKEESSTAEEDTVEIRQSGCKAIHLAALRERVQDIANLIRIDKSCGTQVDNCKNTALHWAVRSRKIGSVECLHNIVPWHFRNTNGETFLDLFFKPASPPLDDFHYYIQDLIQKVLNDTAGDATKKWTCLRSTEKWNSVAMDNLISLTGLREVKGEAINLYCSVKEDMKRPVKARVSENSMYHFAFIGNPGVGKTTVAKLFADILVELGLRENKFVETTGQKLLDAGGTIFPNLLQSANPGVLFIDEVYQLEPKSNRDGMSIVNQLLDATETFRKQFTVIIGGYKEEVLEKFFSANIGLPSRFTRIVSFENFDVEELRSIFLASVEAKAWTLQKPWRGTTDIATIVAKRLYRGKDAKGYANARSVRNYLEYCIGRANERMVKERTNGKQLTDAERVTLKRVDILGNEFIPEDSNLLKKLNEMIGLDAVKKVVRSLAQMVRQNRKSEEAGEDVIDIVLHRVFLGNPGTGKTSIAKVYGRLLNEMGFLSNGDVVIVGASKLTGDVVGSASKKTNDLIDSAAGKVLVIDEAYILANSMYGKEALDVLVERIQGGPREDIAVILCGYENEMRKMMRDCNPGLSRRFRIEDAFRFEDYSDDDLVIIMQQRAQGMGLYVSEDVAKAVVKKVISKQRAKPNFGNVGAVNNLLDRGKERCMRRVAENVQGSVEKHDGRWVIIEADLRNVRKDPLDPATNPLFLELNDMIGLQAVKQSVFGLARLAEENWKSEVAGEDVIDIVLHRVFLGNPGTGKTSIAKVYGRLLNEMGFLSNGDVVVVGASKLTGDAVGTSAKKTNDLIDSAAGKVLVIDEAYILANSMYGKEALDVLVERIQGGPGEDIAVILCGYEEEMRKMMRDCNPGLSRRFRIEDAFRFEDYSDDDLVIIMQQRAQGMGLYVSEDVAKAVVKKVISKQRAKPNFGNVGAVNNLLDRGKERCMQRFANGSGEKCNGKIVLIEKDMVAEQSTQSVKVKLDRLYNSEHIVEHLALLRKQVIVTRRKGGDEKALLKNYIFTGPPGTGKTTVARAMGEMYHELGLLSTSEVIECRATDLIAAYVGQSSGLVIEKMNAARGGVLFIDEAYGLNPSRSPYAIDAIETLLGNMTDPKYQGNLVVILAGYPEQMQELMNSNSGLSRRFTERLAFKAWTPADCDQYLRKLIRESNVGLRQFDEPCILHYFTDLCSRQNWGNAGDVLTIMGKIGESRNMRSDEFGEVIGPFLRTDLDFAFQALLDQRPEFVTIEKSSAILSSKSMVQEDGPRRATNEKEDTRINEKEPAEAEKMDVVTECHQMVNPEKEEEDLQDDEDAEIWTALEEACSELGYSLDELVEILRSGNYPSELLTVLQQRSKCRTNESLLKMLEPQRLTLLPRVEEGYRLLLEEREQIRSAKEQRERQLVQERLRKIGRCPMNYEWIALGNGGGYRCAGGSHSVSMSELTYVE